MSSSISGSVGFAIMGAIAFFYGMLRGDAKSGLLKRYVLLSCYVITGLLVCGFGLTYIAYRTDPARNAEWVFGAVATIEVAIAGWVCFSVGYAVRSVAGKRGLTRRSSQPLTGGKISK